MKTTKATNLKRQGVSRTYRRGKE